MTPILLPVPHQPQQNESDCLAACAAMLLAYYKLKSSYSRILRLLSVQWYGTPFTHLSRLSTLHLTLQIGQADPNILYPALAATHPIIVSIQAGELPYYETPTDHAVVVVGMDAAYIYLHDPVMAVGAIPVPKGEFALAWLAKDEKYAVKRGAIRF